jgi:hypothetical protein
MFRSRPRAWMVTLAIAAGAAIGAAGVAGAASNSTSTPSWSGGNAPAGAPDPAKMTHGPGETVLTGSAASKARAAALAAVPAPR